MLYHKEKELTTLVDEFIGGSESAFEEIARLATPDMVNIAYYYLGNVEDAKDVTQDVLIKLYSKLRSFRHGSKLSTWMYRVVMNASIDSLRKRNKVIPLEEAITKDEAASTAAVDNIQRKDIQERIQNVLADLPLRQKNVIILKHFEGLKISQISQVLGCSQSSVKTHLVRAISSLRRKLGGQNEVS